jgi:soluble lytic murein transglycosylase-like protein
MRRVLLGAIGVILASTVAHAGDATSLVAAEARKQGVPVKFALYMAKIESGVQCGNHNRRSSATGPLQVLRGTARALGYRGDIRKASCAVQTHYGMKHLAMCYRAARGNQALAKRCHQQGISAIYKRKKRR